MGAPVIDILTRRPREQKAGDMSEVLFTHAPREQKSFVSLCPIGKIEDEENEENQSKEEPNEFCSRAPLARALLRAAISTDHPRYFQLDAPEGVSAERATRELAAALATVDAAVIVPGVYGKRWAAWVLTASTDPTQIDDTLRRWRASIRATTANVQERERFARKARAVLREGGAMAMARDVRQILNFAFQHCPDASAISAHGRFAPAWAETSTAVMTEIATHARARWARYVESPHACAECGDALGKQTTGRPHGDRCRRCYRRAWLKADRAKKQGERKDRHDQ